VIEHKPTDIEILQYGSGAWATVTHTQEGYPYRYFEDERSRTIQWHIERHGDIGEGETLPRYAWRMKKTVGIPI